MCDFFWQEFWSGKSFGKPVASLKKLDEDTAAEYDALLDGLSQDQEAVEVKEAPSSGSKIGLFVSAIAVVGVAAVLGDVFAL